MALTDKFSNKINYKHTPEIHNFSAAEQILPLLLRLKTVNSILDIGCGTGTWLCVANKLGVPNILGIDGVDLNDSELNISANDFIRQDLSIPFKLDKNFDMLLCLEVAEHLPEESSETLIDTLTSHCDFIIFSAAIPGQGGQNHINEQWPEYWQKLFLKKGYYPCGILRDLFWDNSKVEWWYKQNMLIYAPKNILSALNLKDEKKVTSIIHPDLFNNKLQRISFLSSVVENELKNHTIKGAFRNLIKSITNKFKSD